MELLLEAQGNFDLFTADGFQLTLAYLVNIFEALNPLNRHVQCSHSSRIDLYDSIGACIEKLQLWFR